MAALGCAAVLAAGPDVARAVAPSVAPGFVVENAIPGSHIEAPVGVAFTPDGRLLVADVPGRVWVVKNGVQQPVPMWAHETEVEINGDCGLLGMALDPQFASNRYLYLLYAVDPDSNGVDDDSLHFGRLVRYQTSLANPDRIDESTRTILFGTSWADGPPTASGTHSVGCLRFGADGTLLVSVGEGAHYSGGADSGGRDPDMFIAGRTPADQDHGAFRARMLNSLGGKVLRLDPATGHGVPGNPWYSGDGSDVASKIWAYGLRNPFRFTVRPGTGSSVPANADPGALFIGDVGWNTWEELDVATSPGQDFGWPCHEGARVNAPYAGLAPAGGECPAPGGWTPPAFAISHVSPDSSDPRGLRGNAITTGPFYTHTQFPQPWRNRLLFADFYRGWIRATSVGADQQPFGYDDLAFDMQGPVDMAIEPSTGYLYVACIIDDRVRRIRWAPAAGVGDAGPAVAAFGAPRPNPSNGSVAFTLTLRTAESVSFEVLDLAGRVMWRESARELPAGEHAFTWPGTGADGRAAAPGVYLARARTPHGEWLRRCVRLR